MTPTESGARAVNYTSFPLFTYRFIIGKGIRFILVVQKATVITVKLTGNVDGDVELKQDNACIQVV